ncbi:hypothetical protein AB833_31535 [Chromatiales bacterium (ex Bugula neritina AB1)]|nr:hypothetical protein AB833_31535 [Chromatiales bacterium (ex Bugula neritina AB1)]
MNGKYYVESSSAYQFELTLLEQLFASGVPVAKAVPVKSGDLLGFTATDAGERAFALFPYADVLQLRSSAITFDQSR